MPRRASIPLKLLMLLVAGGQWASPADTGACPNQSPAERQPLGCMIINLHQGAAVASTNHNPSFPTGDFSSAIASDIGTGIASQLSTLPIPSTASGFTYTFDPVTGSYSRSSQSFGPILTERAETIGQHKFLLGFSYQRFALTTLDGLNLHSIPAIFKHQPNPDIPRSYLDDVVTADFNIDLNVNQFSVIGTYGITDGWDVSVAIPILNVSLGAVSSDTIQRIGTGTATNSDGTPIHFFPSPNGPLSQETFGNSGSASGIGDVIVRTKHTLKRWEHGGLAFATDFRLPSGDPYNYLGSGAFGIKPFFALSLAYSRFSPHFNLGYQWNAKSVLAGDITTGYKRHLPSSIPYAAGVDLSLIRRLTLGFDVIGQELINSNRLTATTFTAANGATFPNVAATKGAANITNGSFGIKLNPTGRLLLFANMLFKMNDGGLRSSVAPLFGITYTR